MKLIRCVFGPGNVEAVVEALTPFTTGMTVFEARESDGAPHHKLYYRGFAYEVATPRVVIEIATDDSWVDDLIARISLVQRSAALTDGKIYVFPVEASYHVRNGFMDI